MNRRARHRIFQGVTAGALLALSCIPLWASGKWVPYVSAEAYIEPGAAIRTLSHSPNELSPPGAADLAETKDVKFTTAITLIAGALGPNPVDLYNFVHDTIEFDIYFGSLKGADGCLREGRGNDFDQASLLIALLRYHGIPARYEFGTLRLSLDQAQQLSLTNIDIVGGGNLTAINQSLSSMGIPAIRVLGDPQGTYSLFVDVDLCWVRAYVPSTNYRGRTGGGFSASDWIHLFPAFKQHEYIPPQVNLKGKVLFDQDDFFQNAPIDELPIKYFQDKVFTYILANNLPCPTLSTAMIERRIVPERLDVLPVALPAPIVIGQYGSYNYLAPVVWSEIPTGFRHQMTIQATYEDPYWPEPETDFSATITLPESYGKKIAVEWPGATKADQEAIEIAGGIEKVPRTAMLNLSARLTRGDDELLKTGGSHPIGFAMKLHAIQRIPNYAFAGLAQVGRRTTFIGNEEHEYDLSVGGAAVLAMETTRIPDDVWGYHIGRVEALRSEGASASRIRTQELQIIGLDYLRQNDYGERVFSGIHHWNFNHYWYVMEIADLLMEPDPIWGGGGAPAGTRIDFLANVSPHPIDGDFSLDFEVTNASGHNGSGLEFEMLNKYVNQTSVAYVNLMQRAYQIYDGYIYIDPSNVNTFQSELVDIPSNIVSGIKSHVNAGGGNVARCPKRQIRVNNWKGLGYYKGNAIAGTGAYLIYGGFE